MIMLFQRLRFDSPSARHAQVEDHRLITIGLDQPVFGAPAQLGDHGAGQLLHQ